MSDGQREYYGIFQDADDEPKNLRDEFAMAALAAWPVTDRNGSVLDLAEKCYLLADAMLLVRTRPAPPQGGAP